MTTEKRFNTFKNKFIKLSEGEQFCKKCRGRGMVPNKSKEKFFPFSKRQFLICNICLGDGKIDWVEKVIGKTYKGFVE